MYPEHFLVKPKTSGFGTASWHEVRTFVCRVPVLIASQGFWHGWQADH
jgi:hypothetical protein